MSETNKINYILANGRLVVMATYKFIFSATATATVGLSRSVLDRIIKSKKYIFQCQWTVFLDTESETEFEADQ